MPPSSKNQWPTRPADDPFPASPQLASYVPLPSREQVAAYVSAKLTEAPGVVELSGPSGVGKSLLMRVLAERLRERFAAIHVPIPTLTPDELATWVRQEGGGRDTLVDRRQSEARPRALPKLLLVEDAQELPQESADWIETWCAATNARALLAFTEEIGARRSSARRAFVEPLELREIAPYVESHLQRSGAPREIRQLFAGEGAHTLALRSRGIPRAIHRLADQRLMALAAMNRGAMPPSPFSPPPRRRPDAHPAATTKPLVAPRAARGYFLAGVASALFLGSLTLSVPSPLADGPERPARLTALVEAAPVDLARVVPDEPATPSVVARIPR